MVWVAQRCNWSGGHQFAIACQSSVFRRHPNEGAETPENQAAFAQNRAQTTRPHISAAPPATPRQRCEDGKMLTKFREARRDETNMAMASSGRASRADAAPPHTGGAPMSGGVGWTRSDR